MTAQVFKAIGGGLLSARLVVIVEFLPCLRAHGAPASRDSGLKSPYAAAARRGLTSGSGSARLDLS
jgi:hypothetical protein